MTEPKLWMVRRINRLKGKEAEYWEDEFYSDVAITNLDYRDALEEALQAEQPKRATVSWQTIAERIDENERRRKRS